mmetsp:Transcript_60048/g.132015  ORF Transcript_60048/g.132015 Transcript_60048/m.132015 type:complete len:211 (-) Transcript_60048:833-1465(-)
MSSVMAVKLLHRILLLFWKCSWHAETTYHARCFPITLAVSLEAHCLQLLWQWLLLKWHLLWFDPPKIKDFALLLIRKRIIGLLHLFELLLTFLSIICGCLVGVPLECHALVCFLDVLLRCINRHTQGDIMAFRLHEAPVLCPLNPIIHARKLWVLTFCCTQVREGFIISRELHQCQGLAKRCFCVRWKKRFAFLCICQGFIKLGKLPICS